MVCRCYLGKGRSDARFVATVAGLRKGEAGRLRLAQRPRGSGVPDRFDLYHSSERSRYTKSSVHIRAVDLHCEGSGRPLTDPEASRLHAMSE